MKALKFLKHMKQTDTPYNFREWEINKAIEELEEAQLTRREWYQKGYAEAMKTKTCYGCKQSWEPNNQTFHKYFCEYLKIPIHGDFYCNRYEPKDNA